VGQTYLQLKADRFSNTLFDSADEWAAFVAGDATIQAEKSELLVIRSVGAQIGGAQFG
jgi:hypothetical protein